MILNLYIIERAPLNGASTWMRFDAWNGTQTWEHRFRKTKYSLREDLCVSLSMICIPHNSNLWPLPPHSHIQQSKTHKDTHTQARHKTIQKTKAYCLFTYLHWFLTSSRNQMFISNNKFMLHKLYIIIPHQNKIIYYFYYF